MAKDEWGNLGLEGLQQDEAGAAGAAGATEKKG